MSKESFQLIIGRALLEMEFRQALFADPEQALLGFQLNAVERRHLKYLDSETLELLARILNSCLEQNHKK